MSLQQTIINWYLNHKRDLPWRRTTDPYVIWLSEVILQQTRVDQGLPYFNRFLENFPTVVDFAKASEDEVLKLWQGLGYYSRGRNMLITARTIVEHYQGIFPTRYQDLVKLKGIGDYTAAAISSFSANEPRAVLDGNVFRVLSRYFGIYDAINAGAGKKKFSELAQSLIQSQEPSTFNQAIMEFGALQCKPKSPNCAICPLLQSCYAHINHKVDELPIKLKLTKVRSRYFSYFLITDDSSIYIKQRNPGDIWEKLYDLPLIETATAPSLDNSDFISLLKSNFGNEVIVRPLYEKKHVLSHQIIYVHFFGLENYMINFNLHTDIKSVSKAHFIALPHPKVIGDFIELHL